MLQGTANQRFFALNSWKVTGTMRDFRVSATYIALRAKEFPLSDGSFVETLMLPSCSTIHIGHVLAHVAYLHKDFL